ncbi:hypothetical protein J5X98_13880 [Leptothermofonsia sichuanensis E412]|uniref:hypothetical protein n=1 Tax=Leptothermofonsia sichuanensis TaxID=2917832 RepID=UPI001CA683F2|nr:hypothetical protein [Leptothermofonsia sichuanensis]QZZ18585.1 hypothetical protein J5X98_13880 [Leptothermofonsia sichuanensis E412]
MIFNSKRTLFTAILGLGLGAGISGCSVSSLPFLPGESPEASSASPSPVAATSPAASIEPAASPSPAQKPKPPSRPPLTVEKLKNTEYYILADGPIKLTKGTFTDDKKRVFTLEEPVAYGDLNRDGIKDAIAPLTITIDGRKFTYLVGVINEGGNPRHASAEFLGERAKVKTLSANAGKITVKMDKYSPGDRDGYPSQTVTREYTFKPFKSAEEEKKEKDKAKDSNAKDKKPEANKSSTDKKEDAKPSPSP